MTSNPRNAVDWRLMTPRETPVIATLIEHRNRVLGLGYWLQGAEFADEHGWLEPEEAIRFEHEDAGWNETLRELSIHVRRVRETHALEFLAWVDYEITECKVRVRIASDANLKKSARKDLRAWQAVRGDRRDDFFFERLPAPATTNSRLTIRALAGDEKANKERDMTLTRISLSDLKQILLLPRATPSHWVADGCPAVKENRRLHFDPVDLLRWFDEKGYPKRTNAVDALWRLAYVQDAGTAFIGVVDMAKEVAKITGFGVALPRSEGVEALNRVLERCAVVMSKGKIEFVDDAALVTALHRLLAEALHKRAGGDSPLRPLSGRKRWCVAAWEGSHSGGPFELEVEHFWTVIDWNNREIVLRFEGKSEHSYVGGPGGWGKSSYSGTRKVEISEAGRFAIVTKGAGNVEQHRLPE